MGYFSMDQTEGGLIELEFHTFLRHTVYIKKNIEAPLFFYSNIYLQVLKSNISDIIWYIIKFDICICTKRNKKENGVVVFTCHCICENIMFFSLGFQNWMLHKANMDEMSSC